MTKPTDRDFSAGPTGLDASAFARWYREQIVAKWQTLDTAAVAKVAALIEEARDRGRQVFVMGNGGSAAAASHFAVDLSKTAAAPGKPPLRCISLSDNAAYLTACGNDLGYEHVFARQLENLVQKGDLVLLISGSGNSPNVLEAAKLAKSRGALTIAFVGFDGGKLKGIADVSLHIDAKQYGVVEDMHMSLGHIIAFYLRQKG
ncbi:MAG: SIS domain-containing protein [Elusimicrobia bacterium]|nr:SIS domain-containing protein [Elusimicrobiota bacterium]